MSVLAESARRAEQGQFHSAGTLTAPGYGPAASAQPPFAEAGSSSAAQPASPGTWRDSLGGNDLMSVVAHSARRTEQPQFYAAGTVPSSPGYGVDASAWPPIAEAGGSAAAQPAPLAAWHDSFDGGTLGSVVAESARRSELGQFYAADTVASPGYGLDASARPPFAEAGGSSAAQPAMARFSPGTLRDGLGANELMSVVAGSARRSEQTQFYAAGTVPSSPGYGQDASAWPPFAAAGSSSAAQPAMPPATWRDSFGGGDLMTVVAQSARRPQPPQFLPSGSASPMGGEWGSTMASFAIPAAAPPAQAAAPSQPGSYQLPAGSARYNVSQAEFDTMANLVKAGVSLSKALISIRRTDVPASTARRWLTSAGVQAPKSENFGSRPPSLSVAQIETALRAQEEYINRTGAYRGSVSAAHQALGDAGGNFSTFRDYFSSATHGLSAHGRAMLEQARAFESRGARKNGSGPSA